MDEGKLISSLSLLVRNFFDLTKKDDLFKQSLNLAVEQLNADRSTIFILPDRSTTLESFLAIGLEEHHIEVKNNQGIAGYVFQTGQSVISDDVTKDPRFFSHIDNETGYTTKNLLASPIKAASGRTIGVLQILNKKEGRFSKEDLNAANILAFFLGIALESQKVVSNLEKQKELLANSYKQNAFVDNIQLHSTNQYLSGILKNLNVYAENQSNVLILGESGTGKEVMAQKLHELSHRRSGPFIAVNCAALPDSLFEAELFGVEKGAATGTSARKGKIELSEGGTLFLDEIGELTLPQQAKLLRVLQDHKVSRVGSSKNPVEVDFRLVAATNRDLKTMVKDHTFREDLYYRLNVVSFVIPPLRERRDDLEELTGQLIERLSITNPSFRGKYLSPETLACLKSYEWPGNIRQLQNRLEHALIVSSVRKEILPHDLGLDNSAPPSNVVNLFKTSPLGNSFVISLESLKLKDVKMQAEGKLIDYVLEQTEGNKAKAAKLMGITREGLRKVLIKIAA